MPGPTAHSGVGNLGVTSVTLTNGGTGYTNQATITVGFSGGGGSGAAATATIQTTSTTTSYVASVSLTAGGSGYTSAPSVVFSGGGGAGAVAVATVTTSTITTYYVDHVDVTATGSGIHPYPAARDQWWSSYNTSHGWAQISGGTKFRSGLAFNFIRADKGGSALDVTDGGRQPCSRLCDRWGAYPRRPESHNGRHAAFA